MRTDSRIYRCLSICMIWLLATSMSSNADTLLSITINDNDDARITLTDEDLLALPQVTIETSTPWDEEAITFSGPTLKALLTQNNIFEGELNLYALNRYQIQIPWEYIEDTSPIIANRMNGSPFSRRERGPLWIIFPFDADERYQSYEVSAMSIWQLISMEIDTKP